MTEDEDYDDLVRKASRGDAGACDQLLERHLPALRVFVRLRMGDLIRTRESEGDIVQSVCREVLEGAGEFEYRGEDAFRGWLFTMTLRKLVDRDRFYRRERRDAAREIPIGAGAEDSSAEVRMDFYRTMFTPSRDAAMREEARRFEAAFDMLPEHYREVILLTRIVGVSHREAAATMGRSEVAIQGLLTRALVRLSALLHRGDAGLV